MAAPIDARLIRRASATKVFLASLVGVGLVTAVLILIQAHLISTGVATVFDTRSLDGIAVTAGLILVCFAARSFLSWINEWLAHRSSAQVKSTLRQDIVAARLASPTDSSTSSASLVNLVTTHLNDLDGYYAKFLPQLVLAVVVPIVLIVPIFIVDALSGVIITVTIPLIPLFMILVGLNTQRQVARRFKVQYRLANHFADLVQGLPTLQAFGRAREQVRGLRESEGRHHDETMKTLKISFLSAGVLELASTLSVALVAVTIGFRVVYGHLDLAPALFVLVIAPEVYLPIRLVGSHFHDSQNGMAAASRAFAMIEAGERTHGGGNHLVGDDVSVAFDDVTFTYPDSDAPVLDGFCLRVDPGEIVVLTGTSGIGKSTVLSLLMGFYTPESGMISVGGRDLKEIDLASWRAATAWVGQRPGLINGTVADNVALGHPAASTQMLREALDRAGGEDLDLDHIVGDDGEGLSSGQRRRVGLARALLKISCGGGRMLILDEPTAGLDSTTELAAVEAVRAAQVSALIVSHRAAVMEMADRVVEFSPSWHAVVGSVASADSTCDPHTSEGGAR